MSVYRQSEASSTTSVSGRLSLPGAMLAGVLAAVSLVALLVVMGDGSPGRAPSANPPPLPGDTRDVVSMPSPSSRKPAPVVLWLVASGLGSVAFYVLLFFTSNRLRVTIGDGRITFVRGPVWPRKTLVFAVDDVVRVAVRRVVTAGTHYDENTGDSRRVTWKKHYIEAVLTEGESVRLMPHRVGRETAERFAAEVNELLASGRHGDAAEGHA